jgi:acetyl esterase/lipase
MLVSSPLHAQKSNQDYTLVGRPGSENWNWTEKSGFSSIWSTPIVYNITEPTLTVYEPAKGKANGTSIIIAPGGAFQILSITKEGSEVAQWMADHGITAFLLKYRVNRSFTDNPVQEVFQAFADSNKMRYINDTIIPMTIADAQKALEWVRSNASTMKLDPKKVGMIGFSAGGTAVLGSTLNHTEKNTPNFLVLVYAYSSYFRNMQVPPDAPPVFITGATDDSFGFAPDFANVYTSWIKAKKSAELHIYSRGGHGFGMKKQKLPSDQWIDRLADWLVQIKML